MLLAKQLYLLPWGRNGVENYQCRRMIRLDLILNDTTEAARVASYSIHITFFHTFHVLANSQIHR